MSGKLKGTQVLGFQNVQFYDPLPDVHAASLPIAGCGWVDTSEGIVLIDTLISRGAAKKVKEKIKEKVKYIIYTHGHGDHIGGTEVFLDDKPEIIASKYLPDRFDRYKMLAPHRAHITAVQFNVPEVTRPLNYVYPTKTFIGEMTIKLGDKTFELHATRAETDDAVWVYIPEIEVAFIGDLLIGSMPNVGNPWKPTRFTLDWAKALEEVRAKEPKYIFFNGAGRMHKGDQALKALDANIEIIHSLHDQVVEYINQNVHITEMIHKVKIPVHLKNSPYLRELYSRVEFFVFNLYRWYHGYFDDNPAHLLPRPEKEVMKETFELIGDPEKVIKRAEELLDENQAQLALQILDILIQAKPEHVEARKLRMKLLEILGAEDYCLMSRNTWVYFRDQDKKYLKNKKEM